MPRRPSTRCPSSGLFRVAAAGVTLLLTASTATAAGSTDVPLQYRKCGRDQLNIKSVTVTDNPAKAGEQETLRMTFTPSAELTGGRVSVVVEKFGMQLLSQDLDLCTGVGLTCPVPAGQESEAVVLESIPATVPATTATAHVTVTDAAGQQLACLKADVQVVKCEEHEACEQKLAPPHPNLRRRRRSGDVQALGEEEEEEEAQATAR